MSCPPHRTWMPNDRMNHTFKIQDESHNQNYSTPVQNKKVCVNHYYNVINQPCIYLSMHNNTTMFWYQFPVWAGWPVLLRQSTYDYEQADLYYCVSPLVTMSRVTYFTAPVHLWLWAGWRILLRQSACDYEQGDLFYCASPHQNCVSQTWRS